MISERDAVIRERAAFVAGANFRDLYCPCEARRTTGAEAEAKARFALPKVTRPRVVRWNDYEYKHEIGFLWQRHNPEPNCSGDWILLASIPANAEPRYLRLIADLTESPNELVDADA